MAIKYLVDTNTISEPERTRPDEQVVVKLHDHRNEIAIASVVWHELLFGYHRLPSSKRKERVSYFLFNTIAPVIPILPYDTASAEWFGRERARLTGIGRPPAYADGQIAAVTAVNNLILVTRNEKDFATFPDLVVENWFSS